MWAMRDAMAPAFDALNAQAQAMYPVDIEEVSLGGVRCHRVRPAEADRRRPGALLINLHGGGFVVGSGALVEAIPVAVLTGFEVIAVDYRLAPEHPYPAAVEDVLAVYRACLAEHDGVQVGLYGSSAGGFLTAQAIARMLDRLRVKFPEQLACSRLYRTRLAPTTCEVHDAIYHQWC